MDLFLTNMHLFTSQYINWWTGVVWIIVMFLSAVWTLILTAPIHCRGSIIVLGDMLNCHIVLLSACEIADTQYYPANLFNYLFTSFHYQESEPNPVQR